MKNQYREIKCNALKMFSALAQEGSAADTSGVRKLIGEVRDSLSSPGQQLGMWESIELNEANRALEACFPRLALIAAGKAIAVHALSPEEYAFGFSAMRQQPERLSEQSETAQHLILFEKATARRLRCAQVITAAHLRTSQSKSAAALERRNQEDADVLAKAGALQLKELEATDSLREGQQREMEQLVSWMAGGYSVECPVCLSPFSNPSAVIHDEQETAALNLKQSQRFAAEDLKEGQMQAAADLTRMQSSDADSLKSEQRQRAIDLAREKGR